MLLELENPEVKKLRTQSYYMSSQFPKIITVCGFPDISLCKILADRMNMEFTNFPFYRKELTYHSMSDRISTVFNILHDFREFIESISPDRAILTNFNPFEILTEVYLNSDENSDTHLIEYKNIFQDCLELNEMIDCAIIMPGEWYNQIRKTAFYFLLTGIVQRYSKKKIIVPTELRSGDVKIQYTLHKYEKEFKKSIH